METRVESAGPEAETLAGGAAVGLAGTAGGAGAFQVSYLTGRGPTGTGRPRSSGPARPAIISAEAVDSVESKPLQRGQFGMERPRYEWTRQG